MLTLKGDELHGLELCGGHPRNCSFFLSSSALSRIWDTGNAKMRCVGEAEETKVLMQTLPGTNDRQQQLRLVYKNTSWELSTLSAHLLPTLWSVALRFSLFGIDFGGRGRRPSGSFLSSGTQIWAGRVPSNSRIKSAEGRIVFVFRRSVVYRHYRMHNAGCGRKRHDVLQRRGSREEERWGASDEIAALGRTMQRLGRKKQRQNTDVKHAD